MSGPQAARSEPTAAARARVATLVAAAIAILGLILAWQRRFVLDDAFIGFEYARAWVSGHGPTWFGDRVEGYTSFLWVLWTALGLRLGVDAIAWVWAASLLSYAVLLHATWQLGKRLCGAPWPALFALVLLVTNATVAAFATSGLETMLQAALLAQTALQLVRLHGSIAAARTGRPPITRHARHLSIWIAFALLTRLDSAVPAAVFGLDAWWALRRDSGLPAPVARRCRAHLVLPVAICVAAWFGWKLAYYHAVLPNTYAAKVHWDLPTLGAGGRFLWRFLDAYLLWPFGIVAAAAWALRRVPLPPGTAASWRAIASATLGWLLYLAAVGGDFMEFRMLVPVLAFVFLLLALPLWALLPRFAPAVAIAVALVLGFASQQYARTARGVSADRRLDSVPALADFYGLYPDRDWSSLGRELREQLGGTDAVLALHAVGAIPYFSGLRSVDMYGLTDRDIARHGTPAPPHYRRPGHRRQATLAQLRARHVNLVVAHPTIEGRDVISDARLAEAGAQWVRDALSFGPAPVAQATLVGMPLRHRPGVLRMWYLTPSPAIDAVITTNGWERTTVDVR